MANWQLRYEGTETTIPLDSPQAVLVGIRDEEWQASDEVKGPNDSDWQAIEDHPLFAEAIAEMAPPAKEHPDETRLDMNPLIDVALVLLIFFILTTTYSSLRRSIDLPPPPEDKPGATAKKPSTDEVLERAFRVEAWMEGDQPKIKIEDKIIDPADVEKEVKLVVSSLRRNEMLLEVDGRVPWGIEAMIHDAAKGAEIHRIYRKSKKMGN